MGRLTLYLLFQQKFQKINKERIILKIKIFMLTKSVKYINIDTLTL